MIGFFCQSLLRLGDDEATGRYALQIAHYRLKLDFPFADIELDAVFRVRRMQVLLLLGGSGSWTARI
jgi:hypothetical protein